MAIVTSSTLAGMDTFLRRRMANYPDAIRIDDAVILKALKMLSEKRQPSMAISSTMSTPLLFDFEYKLRIRAQNENKINTFKDEVQGYADCIILYKIICTLKAENKSPIFAEEMFQTFQMYWNYYDDLKAKTLEYLRTEIFWADMQINPDDLYHGSIFLSKVVQKSMNDKRSLDYQKGAKTALDTFMLYSDLASSFIEGNFR